MKIAYILTTYPCPSEIFVQREISQLKKQGFEISVFTANAKTEQSGIRLNTTVYYRPALLSYSAIWSVIYICFRHPILLMKLIGHFAKLLSTYPKEALVLSANFHTVCFFAKAVQNQQIEHIHSYFLSWPACIGLGISILTKLPFSVAAHSRDIFVESRAIQLKAKQAKFITCCTMQGFDYLKKLIEPQYHDKLFLNYHGIELNEQWYGQLNYLKENKSFNLIVAVGRLVEKKGFDHLIEAFSRVVQKKPDASLIIAGEGPQKPYLKDMIDGLGIKNNVYLAGWLEHDLVLKLIRKAKVLVVPSIVDTDGDRDGLPNVILEAFSTNTPVIASNLPGISEAVVSGRTGFLVPPGDKIALADTIERVLTDDSLVSFLTNNAAETLINTFDIEKNCFKLAELFEKKSFVINKKIRIAHIIEGFTGGTSTYLSNILPSLVDVGFDVTLICSLNRYDEGVEGKIDKIKKYGIQVYIVPMARAINPIADIYSFFAILKILFKSRFDIIHTHCSKSGAIGRFAAVIAGIKLRFHSSHCFAFLRCSNLLSKRIYLLIERILARLTTRFIAVSNADANSAKKWKVFSDSKCVIVNNGLLLNQNFCHREKSETISEIKASFNLPNDSMIVVTGVRFVEYKGIFSFLETAKLSESNAIFVIAGEGPLRLKIENYIRCNGLSEKVRLLGYVHNMDRLYRICEVVVLCSQMEAQPYFILEAMRASCAIVASDVPGNRELLSDNRGLLVEREPEKLSKAVDYLLSDRPKRKQLAQNAYEYLCKNHRLEDQIEKLTNIYLNELKIKQGNYEIENYCTEKICSE